MILWFLNLDIDIEVDEEAIGPGWVAGAWVRSGWASSAWGSAEMVAIHSLWIWDRYGV